MPPERKVLVRFKSGQEDIYTVDGIESFHSLARVLSGLWASWVYIGSEAVIRKSEIAAIFYLGADDEDL